MASGSGQYKSINAKRRRLAGNSPAKSRRDTYDKSPGYVPKSLSQGYTPGGR